jgi:hypothetical protein
VTRTTELALATFFLGVAVLAATATSEDPALPRLARVRIAGALGAAVVIACAAVQPVAGFGLGAACAGLLLSVLAICLAVRQNAHLQAWHDDFERPFAEYVRHHP